MLTGDAEIEAAAAELRQTADLVEDHAARRVRLAGRFLSVWTGPHRRHFDTELRATVTTSRELAAALRVAASRIETNLRQ